MNKLRKEAAAAAATVLIIVDNSQPPAFSDPVSAPVTQPSPAAGHPHSASVQMTLGMKSSRLVHHEKTRSTGSVDSSTDPVEIGNAFSK